LREIAQISLIEVESNFASARLVDRKSTPVK